MTFRTIVVVHHIIIFLRILDVRKPRLGNGLMVITRKYLKTLIGIMDLRYVDLGVR